MRTTTTRVAGLAMLVQACSTSPSRDAAPDVPVPDVPDVADVPPDVLADVGPDTGPTACDLATATTIRTVAMLSAGRYSPAGIVLADGRALVAGGYDFTRGAQVSSDVFEPSGDTLSAGPLLQIGRNFGVPARLGDGRVLVVGGFDPTSGSLDVAESYDPGTDEFTSLDERMTSGREAHTVTTLPDGRLLIAGGLQARGLHFLGSAEIYDPVANTFTATRAMTWVRAFHAAAYVPARGAVLLAGGDSGHGENASAELYTVATGVFARTAGGLPHAAKAPGAVPLPDGRVLVAGGANATDGTLADAEVYDPATDRFVPVAPMAARRMAHTLTRLSDGRVLAVGGWSDSSMPPASTGVLEVYDPTTSTWTTLPVALARPRHDHVALLLDDCRVLIAGGQQVVGTGSPMAPLEVEVVTIPRR